LVHLPLHELVPGDVVRLEAGDRVPAEGRLTDARGAMLDESILTGESIALDKSEGDEAFSGLDALEQAIYARSGDPLLGLVHHSDRGTQYLSMRSTDRLADASIAPSVGSRGDAYDNALAESVIGLFKTKVIRRLGPWRRLEAVEFATLAWVDWFNTRRLLEPIGYVPPAEYEARYYQQAAVA
jgi:transposase InsO family protein